MSLNYNELAKELKQTKAKIVILEEFIWKYQRIINDARKSMNYMSKKHKRAFKRLEDVFEDFEEDKDFQALKKEFYLEHLDCTRSFESEVKNFPETPILLIAPLVPDEIFTVPEVDPLAIPLAFPVAASVAIPLPFAVAFPIEIEATPVAMDVELATVSEQQMEETAPIAEPEVYPEVQQEIQEEVQQMVDEVQPEVQLEVQQSAQEEDQRVQQDIQLENQQIAELEILPIIPPAGKKSFRPRRSSCYVPQPYTVNKYTDKMFIPDKPKKISIIRPAKLVFDGEAVVKEIQQEMQQNIRDMVEAGHLEQPRIEIEQLSEAYFIPNEQEVAPRVIRPRRSSCFVSGPYNRPNVKVNNPVEEFQFLKPKDKACTKCDKLYCYEKCRENHMKLCKVERPKVTEE